MAKTLDAPNRDQNKFNDISELSSKKQKQMPRPAYLAMLRAKDAYRELSSLFMEWRQEGVSHSEMARRLRSRGIRTREGGQWTQVQVGRVLRYLESPALPTPNHRADET